MERLKIGIVGLNFGAWMIENEILHGPGREWVEIGAVCDLNAEKAAHWSAALGVPGYTDLDRMLQQPDLEAVGLFTGPVGRADLIEPILRSGRDVLTTKPFELCARRAEQVLELAERLGRVIHLNSPAPLLPLDLALAAEWVRRYDLGRPIAYRASTWCSYREQPNGSWYDDPRLCPAAPIFRLGIYLINDVSWFFTGVQQVQVMQSRVFTARPTADNAQLSILYQNGAIGSIFASFCINDQQFYRCMLELNFERGTIYRNMGPIEARHSNRAAIMELSACVGDRQILERQELADSGGGYQWRQFHQAVKTSDFRTQVTTQQIVSAIQIIEAMAEASP